MRGRRSVRVSRRNGYRAGAIDRVAQLTQTVALLGGIAAIVAVALVSRSALPSRAVTTVGASPAELTALKNGAALLTEQALAKGGSGIRFEVVQFQTIKARPGGRRIEIPHPVDRTKTIGLTDEYFLSSVEERGIVSAAGFWSEIRTGPAPDHEPNWAAPLLYQALDSAGKTWRDDGRGWYASPHLPGVGLDPTTVTLLPALLRNTTAPESAPAEKVGDATYDAMTAAGKVADIPGVVASEGSGFTKLVGRLTFAFDGTGRLAKLEARALNTNMDDFDLVVDTTITFYYDNVGTLPAPTPALAGVITAAAP